MVFFGTKEFVFHQEHFETLYLSSANEYNPIASSGKVVVYLSIKCVCGKLKQSCNSDTELAEVQVLSHFYFVIIFYLVLFLDFKIVLKWRHAFFKF